MMETVTDVSEHLIGHVSKSVPDVRCHSTAVGTVKRRTIGFIGQLAMMRSLLPQSPINNCTYY